MNRVSRILIAVMVCCLSLGVVAAGATAKPKKKSHGDEAGRLDSAFGKGGKVIEAFPAESSGSTAPKYTLPFEFTPGHLEMAKAPGDKVVVAGATKVVRYLADGKLDKGFGHGGSINVPRPPDSVFVLAGVAVDPQGRVVLAGLARPLPSNTTPDPLLSSAAVIRLTSNGSLDPSFGSGGMVVSDLGLGAPKAGGAPYLGASVGLRDVAVDSQDRPVVSGAYVTEIGTGRDSAESKGFVARMTVAGALDPSFGEGGLRTISTLYTLGQLVPSHAGGYLTLAERNEKPTQLMTEINEDGNLDTGFGSFGFRTVPFVDAPNVAVAPSGKIALLGHPELYRAYRKKKEKNKNTGEVETRKVRIYVKKQSVQRLLPSGAGDPSFGRSGMVTFKDPKFGSYAGLVVDSQERVYLAGRLAKGSAKKAKKGPQRTKFLLGRLGPDGTADNSFGKGGTVTTEFGRSSSSFATQAVITSKGHILIGGGTISPQLETGGGFALAEYLPGS